MVDVDVTICGAGISGLLLASELSKSHSVAVLEKGDRAQCSNKFWLTSREALERNPQFSDCVDSEWNELDFIANSRVTYTASGNYVLWDTKKLEARLIDTIRSNRSEIYYKHRFYSYRRSSDKIISYANDTAFCSALVVDCMGYSSPIVSSSRAVSMVGYHHLLGRTMQLRRSIRPVAADNVILSGGSPSFLEVFPKSDGTANVVLIAPSKSVRTLRKLASDFEFIVNQSHYSETLAPIPNANPLYGVVPIGRMKKKALNRVLFYGEAGQTHPAASCTCLTKLLLSYKSVSDHVSKRLESDQLSAADLETTVPRASRFSQRLNQNLFRQLNVRTSDEGQAFVELLQCLDNASVDDLIFGEIKLAHFLQVDNWKRVIKKRNTAWVKPLLQTILSL